MLTSNLQSSILEYRPSNDLPVKCLFETNSDTVCRIKYGLGHLVQSFPCPLSRSYAEHEKEKDLS